ncbi:MAG: type II toxin-antitoxin system death-on-curing family toxin [Bryobacteraceae bacterium]
MKEPRWIPAPAALAIHAELMAEHGGAAGVRDENVLQATLARPRNLHAYARPSLFELAAAYAFGFARNHPFVDGNKRMALAALDVFLRMNRYELAADEPEAASTIWALAEGRVSEAELARWIKRNTRKTAE